jgi:hypothetical protein
MRRGPSSPRCTRQRDGRTLLPQRDNILSDAALAELAAKVAVELGMELGTSRDWCHTAYITDGVHTYAINQHYPLPDTMVEITRSCPRAHYDHKPGERPRGHRGRDPPPGRPRL